MAEGFLYARIEQRELEFEVLDRIRQYVQGIADYHNLLRGGTDKKVTAPVVIPEIPLWSISFSSNIAGSLDLERIRAIYSVQLIDPVEILLIPTVNPDNNETLDPLIEKEAAFSFLIGLTDALDESTGQRLTFEELDALAMDIEKHILPLFPTMPD